MISVREVSKRFGGVQAVQACSFEIEPGSITGLIGPNGAGKTTLFNIVTGYLRPSAGQVLLEGRDVTGLAPHRLFRRGLVRTFQIPLVFERMTVLDNLMLVPAGQHGESLFTTWLRWGRVRHQERAIRKRAAEVLSELQMPQIMNEPAGHLSGGQKKLLELGRVMMASPRVVLLDEPGAGVNPTLMAKLCDDVRRLNRERGYTFCIIEHDMDLVAELCDPVVVMAEGSVMTQGTMAQVRRDERVLEAYFGRAGRTPEAAR